MIYFSPPAVLEPSWQRKSFFSTNFYLSIPQNLAYTAVSLKSLWKQILEVGRELTVHPQTQFANSLPRLASLNFIPSQDEEASYLRGICSLFGPV